MSWGSLPQDIVEQLNKREWENTPNLRKRLLGERKFPIRISLKPPNGTAALQDLGRFKKWIEIWRQWPTQKQLTYELRSYRQIGQHNVPTTITLSSMCELTGCLGERAMRRRAHWEQVMAPVLTVGEVFYPALVRNLESIESLSVGNAKLLAQLLPQLLPGMGAGHYLRALPVKGVDTKFIETYQQLITDLLDGLHDGAVTAAGSLSRWLGCRESPKDWLFVRPLCLETKNHLAGLSILRLPSEVLIATPLPSNRILIVENVQSGLALPCLHDTIAVFGGGRNLLWTQAHWLADKHVVYWGDIDTWGLKCLSDARQRITSLDTLMMDRATLDRFSDRIVPEQDPCLEEPPLLNSAELALYRHLITAPVGAHRLEQERLDADYIQETLRSWTC